MRPVGPTWGFVLIGAVFIVGGAVSVMRPAFVYRMRQVADEDDRDLPPKRSGLVIVRALGCVMALVGIYAVVAVLLR
jgi:hypothetical protein